jgi:solute carrier family 25 phosphate transporter 3
MTEKKKVQLYTPQYYGLCAIGGLLACGLTHTSVVTFDILKCRKQVGIKSSVAKIIQTEGFRRLFLGWAPTFVGYSIQGVCKYGFYEIFKKTYSDLVGPERAPKYKDILYLSASASAEFIADIGLCPWEAVKVRIQTANPYENPRKFPTTLREGLPIIWKNEGLIGFYKGIVPLWSRQIPYTMMKFWAFERTVEALYKHVVPKPKSECTKLEQLGVSFVGGYIAGIFCALVSHPADSVVSKLNQYATRPPIMHILRELGPLGVWRGIGLRIFMIGTLTALQWFIYDSFKVYVGLPTTTPIQKGEPHAKARSSDH